jgi:hypothetical protein
MPATIEQQGNVWRVVEQGTKNPVMNPEGTAVDGGGHTNRGQALAQATAINNERSDSGRAF